MRLKIRKNLRTASKKFKPKFTGSYKQGCFNQSAAALCVRSEAHWRKKLVSIPENPIVNIQHYSLFRLCTQYLIFGNSIIQPADPGTQKAARLQNKNKIVKSLRTVVASFSLHLKKIIFHRYENIKDEFQSSKPMLEIISDSPCCLLLILCNTRDLFHGYGVLTVNTLSWARFFLSFELVLAF